MSTYLFQRPESANWYIRLYPPNGGKRVEKSLGTSDRRQAELLALPLITQHKAALLAKPRLRMEQVWRHTLEPGRHDGPDGGLIIATERELIHLDAKGSIIKTEPNGGLALGLMGPQKGMGFDGVDLSLYRLFEPTPEFAAKLNRPKVARKDGDDNAIWDAYLERGGKRQTGVQGKARHDADLTWNLFRTLTDNKPLKNCTRDDGRALVAHLESKKLKSATIQRQLKPLAAAINLAIGEGKFSSVNPFVSVAPKRDDALERVPFNDADIELIKSKLGDLPESRALLLRLLACTGMRLSEAFQIDGEQSEKGVRFVIIGTKTANSKRRVPLPASVLPYLPKAIKGKLFEGESQIEGAALRRFIRGIGIADPAKVVHSFRHRAKDQLRAAACPLDVQYELLGHEVETVAAGYGRGSPVPLLKEWIDRIGF